MSVKRIIDAELPGLPVSINRIVKAVGDARPGDTVTALIPYPGYQDLVDQWLERDYPHSSFEIKTKRKDRKLWIEIRICHCEQSEAISTPGDCRGRSTPSQ